MTSTVEAQFGALSDTAIGQEPMNAYGVPVTPTTCQPMTGNSLMLDPGLFSPELMFGHRDKNTFPLNGQYKIAGSVAGPVFPTNGAMLICGAIGPDAPAGYGVTGSTPTSATTLAAAIVAGTDTFTLASATGYAVGDIIQVDANNPTTPTTAECRKIATLSGVSGTVDVNWTYAHANTTTAVHVVVAPFTHTLNQSNTLNSYTVEKNLGGPTGESLQFAGAKVNKLSINATATDSEATLTADLVAQNFDVLDTPSAYSVIDEEPFVFSEGVVSVFGTQAAATGFTMDIDNGLISTYTFNGTHELAFLTPGMLAVSGKVDVVWDSFDDATYGYFNKMVNGASGVISLAMTHPASAGAVTLTCENAYLKTVEDSLKANAIITSTLNYTGFLDFTTNTTVGAVIVNASYLPL